MKMLLRYGRAAGARKFISISNAHLDACLYHGPSSIDFARSFVELGGRVCVPTTLNVGAVDALHPELNRSPAEVIEAQRELTALYCRLGCVPTLTCAPYQRRVRPGVGEHIAWAESNAIVFANSVLGARTDRYGDFTDLCAALTGRVPLVGLHCDAHRLPEQRFTIVPLADCDLSRELYFGAVGYAIGQRVGEAVPLLEGLPEDTAEDELKALGASGASSGALALFHVAHLTPESQQASEYAKTRNLPRARIGAQDLHDALRQLCQAQTGEPVGAICLGTPHYSLNEFRQLSSAVAGRVPARVEIYVSTSRETAAAVCDDSSFEPLRAFGVWIVVDTCTYFSPVVRRTEGLILTTSVKYAHYGPGNLRRRVALMPLERCIRSAELGEVAPPC
jgi:predicted aconitase